MKIAILTTDSVPMLGGVADYLHNLCIELSKATQISVYSTVPSTPEFDASLPYPMYRILETRRLGQRFGDGFPLSRKLNTLVWHLKRPYESGSLLKKVQNQFNPDIVFIGRWEERSHFWCCACRAFDIPYILITHGMELTEEKSVSWNKKRQHDLCDAKLLIANSLATKNLLINSGLKEEQIFLLPPGIKPEKLEKLPPEIFNTILSRIGLSQKRYILTLCRLVKRKGVDLAIQAFAEIADDFPNLCFVIAGNGPEFSNLQSLTNTLGLDKRILFLGETDDLTKRALFQGCEFFVMPNRPLSGDMEGFGIVFLEAAMFGKAVIGGNNGGVPDAVLNGETGLLVDTSDSHKLIKEAMSNFLQHPETAYEMGKRGRERALRDFSWESLGLKLNKKLK